MHKIIFFTAIYLSSIFPAHAGVVGDAWGFVTDPLGIARAGQSVEKAVNRASNTLVTLQEATDEDIREYLNSFSSLIIQLEDAVHRQRDDLVREVTREINKFADKIDKSVNRAMIEIECVIVVSMDKALRETFGGNLRFISRDTLEIVLPFKKPNNGILSFFKGKVEDDIISIDLTTLQSYAKTYELIRDRHLDNLKYATPDSPANDLIIVYADIARFGRNTLCHYRNDIYGLELSREIDYFNALVRPWTKAVRLKRRYLIPH